MGKKNETDIVETPKADVSPELRLTLANVLLAAMLSGGHNGHGHFGDPDTKKTDDTFEEHNARIALKWADALIAVQ